MDDIDFDDPRWIEHLAKEERSENPKKKKKAGNIDETHQRNVGLGTSVFAQEGVNPAALRMIEKMGFHSETNASRKPLEINIRTGRKGIDVEKKEESKSDIVYDKWRAEALRKGHLLKNLGSAQRALMELDTREGKERSVLWPDDVQGSASRSASRTYEVDSGSDTASNSTNSLTDNVYDDAQIFRRNEIGLSDEPWRSEEKELGHLSPNARDLDVRAASNSPLGWWASLSEEEQFAHVVDRLRKEYRYCIYCGRQYENEKEMDEECPGETEEEHE